MSEQPENTPPENLPEAASEPVPEPAVASEMASAAASDAAPETAEATDTPPDRLASNPRSPFYAPELLERGIGIRFDGVERTNVDEYCVSEGWVKVAAGKSKDRYGNALTIKLKGSVEPYFRS